MVWNLLFGQPIAKMEFHVILCLIACFVATVRARSLPEESSDPRNSARFKAFEMRFLQMLGMKEKPTTKRNVVVPQYMLDLYNSRVRDPEYISTNMVFKDFATTANTVRAFHHKDSPQNDRPANRAKRNVHLDIASVPLHEELVKAEFRVFNNRYGSEEALGRNIINVYQLIAPGERKLLDSKIVNATSVGWQSYDVLQAVQHWHKTPGENFGLEMEVMSENGNPTDISHLHFDKPHDMDDDQWPHQRPLLALYSRDPNTHLHKKRERRSASQWSKYKGLCKRFSLVVDFVSHLSWNWVVQPTRYNAYMCRGECRYPMAEHMNTTNHAIVQTLVHNVKKYKNKVPAACCVPTELIPAMLLLSHDNAIELKDYPDMSVIACGCR